MLGYVPVLLLVNDEVHTLEVVSRKGRAMGFDVTSAATADEAVAVLRARPADVAFIRLDALGPDGLDTLASTRRAAPSCQVVLVAGSASADTAVQAVKLGARDVLVEPLDAERIERLLAAVRNDGERRHRLLQIDADAASRLEFCGMVGRSPSMQAVFDLVRRLSPHVRTALVAGEAGTGRELVARALHALGPRSAQPFVTVACHAIDPVLGEADLFGRAAPSPEHEPQRGLLELADGGTVFLDEVSVLTPAIQARLARLLEARRLQRVAGVGEIDSDLHIVGATTRDLSLAVAAGRFRSDLYYHLAVVEILLPPLRDRREDIPYLTAAFVRDCSRVLHKPIRGVTAGAEALLVEAQWPGNVRELRSVVERACLLSDGAVVTERDVALSMPRTMRPAVLRTSGRAEREGPASGDEPQLLAAVERDHILRALQRAGGNKKAAARMLGVSRRALYRRLERLDLAETISRRRRADTAAG